MCLIGPPASLVARPRKLRWEDLYVQRPGRPLLEWGWIRTREHEKYASAKVSQKGGPFFSRGVASRRRRRRRRRHGREEWCDLSFQK